MHVRRFLPSLLPAPYSVVAANNPMTYENLLVEQRGTIRILTLNRPSVLNSLNAPLLRELEHAVDAAHADAATRAILITGSGPKAFAAGADIAEFTALDQEATYRNSRRVSEFFAKKLENSPKPVVAAVNGFALGGGFELALACQIRIASENAKFGLPEIKLGLIPGYGGTQRLQRAVGHGKALAMTLTADMIDAAEALNFGLVSAVFPQDRLLDEALALLGRMTANSSQAAAAIVKAVNAANNPDVDGFELEARLFSQAMASSDGREGVSAFLEKRKPNFA